MKWLKIGEYSINSTFLVPEDKKIGTICRMITTKGSSVSFDLHYDLRYLYYIGLNVGDETWVGYSRRSSRLIEELDGSGFEGKVRKLIRWHRR